VERRAKAPHLRQKLPLYFDSNFPRQIVDEISSNRAWKRRCSIHSAYDGGHQRQDDTFHFNLCKTNGYVLVTLDNDFMNDTEYPITADMPGIVRIVASKTDPPSIFLRLTALLHFISSFPLPKLFARETKFQVSPEGCLMRGRHAVSREIITVMVKHGDTSRLVMERFGYLRRFLRR
jgi:predicted nuclease of predicted toxin-antitoxin system